MGKAKKISKKSDLKKQLRKRVSNSLEEMFIDFESAMGKEKFRRNIKKASKALIASVKPERLNSSAGRSLEKTHGSGVVPVNISRVAPDAN